MALLNIPTNSPIVNNGAAPAGPTAPAPVATPSPTGTTLTPAQAAANAAMTASGNYTFANGTTAQAGSTLQKLSTVPNSPANVPSSSSTAMAGLNAQAAVSGAGTAPTPAPTNADTANSLATQIINAYQGTGQSLNQQNLVSELTAKLNSGATADEILPQYVNETSLAGMRQSYATEQANLADEATQKAEDLAANNATYGAQSAQLQAQQENQTNVIMDSLSRNGLLVGNPQLAANVKGAIASKFALLQQDLNAKEQDAQDKIDQGDTAAAAEIRDTYQSTIDSALKDIQTFADQQVTQEREKQTLALSESSKATTQYNTSLSNLTGASPLNSLFDSNGQPISGALNNPAFLNSSAYQQGTAAGLSPQAILSDVQNAVKTSKAAAKQSSLNVDLIRAQIEEANSTTAANSKVLNTTLTSAISGLSGTQDRTGNTIDGKAYNDAVSSIATYGKLTIAQTNAVSGAVYNALSGGNSTQAQNIVKNAVLSTLPAQDKQTVMGLDTIASTIDSINTEIAALPPDQQSGIINGNIQDLVTKFGANPDPELQKLGVELGHLKGLYVANVFGKRAVLNNSGFISNLIPDTKDGSSLMYSDLDGLSKTASDYIGGTLSTVLGDDTYNSIFTGATSTPTTSPVASTPSDDQLVNNFFSQFKKQ